MIVTFEGGPEPWSANPNIFFVRVGGGEAGVRIKREGLLFFSFTFLILAILFYWNLLISFPFPLQTKQSRTTPKDILIPSLVFPILPTPLPLRLATVILMEPRLSFLPLLKLGVRSLPPWWSTPAGERVKRKGLRWLSLPSVRIPGR